MHGHSIAALEGGSKDTGVSCLYDPNTIRRIERKYWELNVKLELVINLEKVKYLSSNLLK